jgi:hypothetical protein
VRADAGHAGAARGELVGIGRALGHHALGIDVEVQLELPAERLDQPVLGTQRRLGVAARGGQMLGADPDHDILAGVGTHPRVLVQDALGQSDCLRTELHAGGPPSVIVASYRFIAQQSQSIQPNGLCPSSRTVDGALTPLPEPMPNLSMPRGPRQSRPPGLLPRRIEETVSCFVTKTGVSGVFGCS